VHGRSSGTWSFVIPGGRGVVPVDSGASAGKLRVRLEGVGREQAALIASLPGITVWEESGDVVVRRDSRITIHHESGDEIATFASEDTDLLVRTLLTQVVIREIAGLVPSRPLFNVGLDILDSRQRGYLCESDPFRISFSGESASYLLLLNIRSDGCVSVLYPVATSELAPVRSGELTELEAGPPFGVEFLKLFGFLERPEYLEKLTGRTVSDRQVSGNEFCPKDAEFDEFLRWIRQAPVNGEAQLRMVTVPASRCQLVRGGAPW
jgi:hypothetical protein